MTLRVKTTILFMLLSIVPISLVSALMFVRGRTIIEDKTRLHLATTNTLKSETLEHWVRSHALVLESVAGIHVLSRSDEFLGREIRKALRFHLEPFVRPGLFLELFMVDGTTGQVFFSTDPLQEGKFRDDQAFFREGREKPYVQDIVFDLAVQRPVMFFSIPIPGKTGSAILAGRADLSGLSRTFETRNLLSDTEDTYLVNQFNYFITEPRFGQDYALKKSLAGRALESARKEGRFTGVYQNYLGKTVMGEVRWLNTLHLYLITEVVRSEAHAPVVRLRNQALVMASLLACLAAGIGWIIAASITRPLTALGAAADQVGQGQFRIHLDTKGRRGELYDLARAFKSMADRLQNTMVSKERLEKEVAVRRKAETELKKAVRSLRQSNKDLQQFAYVASHDLQEPLRMVASFTQLLADRYRDHLDDKARTWIGYAVDGANRMQKLIQDLLSFSRVGTHGHEFEDTDLNQAVSRALDNLKLRVEETGASIVSQDLPRLQADAGQMVMLFQNLIGNSLKFCRDRAPEVRISSEKHQGEWVIEVADNGIGIEPEFQDKIFVIFQRLHTREEYPGTGLGLAVCKRIVQRHGGQIWLTSEPGKGTTFHISLPA